MFRLERPRLRAALRAAPNKYCLRINRLLYGAEPALLGLAIGSRCRFEEVAEPQNRIRAVLRDWGDGLLRAREDASNDPASVRK